MYNQYNGMMAYLLVTWWVVSFAAVGSIVADPDQPVFLNADPDKALKNLGVALNLVNNYPMKSFLWLPPSTPAIGFPLPFLI